MNDRSKTFASEAQITGGRVTFNQTTRDMSGPLIDGLDSTQLHASVQNADLRKKLRVDRVRKMTMGKSAGAASIEDPHQPEWQKLKTLREIETIRETKKSEIVSQMLHEKASNNVRTLHVTPGMNSFITIPVLNNANQNEVYSVRVMDPDAEFTGGQSELRLVTDTAELSHWVVQGKVDRPPAWNLITAHADVVLKPGQ